MGKLEDGLIHHLTSSGNADIRRQLVLFEGSLLG